MSRLQQVKCGTFLRHSVERFQTAKVASTFTQGHGIGVRSHMNDVLSVFHYASLSCTVSVVFQRMHDRLPQFGGDYPNLCGLRGAVPETHFHLCLTGTRQQVQRVFPNRV